MQRGTRISCNRPSSRPVCIKPVSNVRAATLSARRTLLHAVEFDAPSYTAQLVECEASGDWLRAVEILTEAKILKASVESEGSQAAVRAIAKGGQWQRAADMLTTLVSRGSIPTESTVNAVFSSLVQGKALDHAEQLLQVITDLPELSLSLPYNMVARLAARCGHPDRAMVLLNKLVSDDRLVAEGATFSTVAMEYMRIGEEDKATEVLEMRDYL